MKSSKNMKMNMCRYCFLFIMAFLVITTKSQARVGLLNQGITHSSADTLVNNSPGKIDLLQKNVFARNTQAFERLQLLDKLSRQPAENPEIFSNARDEYLYFEKAKTDMEAHDNAIKELNQLMAKIIW